MFSFCKKEGFEFSHSPEHSFTSGVISCLKAEIFWASPHSNAFFLFNIRIIKKVWGIFYFNDIL